MQTHLEQLTSGNLDFGQFAMETADDWRRLAGYLYNRWPLPTAVEVEDVEQELLLGSWQVVERFDPTRGKSLLEYVVFNSVDRAKRWLHKQRSAVWGRDKGASRFPLAFALITDDATMLQSTLFVAPPQEQVLTEREALQRAFGLCRTARETLCVSAIVESQGCIEDAIEWLYEDPDRRLRCRFNCREDVRRAIWRTAYAVAA